MVMHAADELIKMGKSARVEGRVDDALALYVSAVQILEEENDLVKWAHTLRHVAEMQAELKRGDEARKSIEAVLVFYRAEGTGKREMANSLRVAALAEEAAGDAAAGKVFWREAAELYAELRLEEGHIEAQREAGLPGH
jgi:hypothetical protein